jgi:hypothetical protein
LRRMRSAISYQAGVSQVMNATRTLTPTSCSQRAG